MASLFYQELSQSGGGIPVPLAFGAEAYGKGGGGIWADRRCSPESRRFDHSLRLPMSSANNYEKRN